MTLSLFEGYGIEIESVVVNEDTLDPLPVVDELLRAAAGWSKWVEDFEDGEIGWSNELVSHCVEFKTNGPAPSYDGLAEHFLASVQRMNALLARDLGGRLMPTAMHPWMDPTRETRLWPHDNGPVYRAYDALFDCRRHGWANVQSVHVNLPFSGDDEFGRLMAAVRLVLPLIPALAASSPLVEGRATGSLDNRLEFYRSNSERVRAMTGDVIPEPIYAMAEYKEVVLGGLDKELAKIGADAALRGQEWTNARGAIARFDRMAIEIRLIDAQECSAADLAIAAAVSGIVKALVAERWASTAEQRAFPSAPLVALLRDCMGKGPETAVTHPAYLELFGIQGSEPISMGALAAHAVEGTFDGPASLEPFLEVALRKGTLAQRILAAVGRAPERPKLHEVYGGLCDCLATGRSFLPGSP